MRTYFHKYRNLHIWLLADCVLLLAFFSLRGQRWLMNAVAEGFTGPLRRGLGRLCYLVPFSVMEVVVAGAVISLSRGVIKEETFSSTDMRLTR